MHSFPFPAEAIEMTDPAEMIEHTMTGRQFRAAIGTHALASVGAHNIASVPGMHQRGGLAFLARILPMTRGGRAERPRIMGVLVSLTPADEIDIDVRHATSAATTHAHIEGVYIDQLQQIMLALDYDGPDVMNPRYW